MRTAVFLDRDGVINRSPGPGKFVLDWAVFEFLPEVPTCLRRMRAAGLFLVLMTNQSGVGRKLMTQAALDEIHARMQEELGAARLDAIYYCPHHPGVHCPCRKPAPYLIHRAAEEHGLDLPHSFMLGDSGRDMAMGHAAGCRTVLCRPQPPAPLKRLRPEHRPDHFCRTLSEATDWIVSQLAGGDQAAR